MVASAKVWRSMPRSRRGPNLAEREAGRRQTLQAAQHPHPRRDFTSQGACQRTPDPAPAAGAEDQERNPIPLSRTRPGPPLPYSISPLRQRANWGDGQGRPIPPGSSPAPPGGRGSRSGANLSCLRATRGKDGQRRGASSPCPLPLARHVRRS